MSVSQNHVAYVTKWLPDMIRGYSVMDVRGGYMQLVLASMMKLTLALRGKVVLGYVQYVSS